MPEYKHTLDPNFSQKISVAIKRFVVIEPAGSIKTEVGSIIVDRQMHKNMHRL